MKIQQKLFLRGRILREVCRNLPSNRSRKAWLLMLVHLPFSSTVFFEKFISGFTLERTQEHILFNFEGLKISVMANHPIPDVLMQYLEIVYPIQKNWNCLFYCHEGPYEQKPVALEKDDVVIDAGANIGSFSLAAAKKIGPQGRVFAFEPTPDAFTFLEKNGRLNPALNISIRQEALGKTTGELNLFLKGPGSSSGIIKRSEHTLVVPQTTLDDFVRREKLSRVDFIKMDIEGMERDALAGGRETIHRFKPKLSLCSYHLPDDRQVLAELILSIWPDYRIIYGKKKMYAYVPKNA